MNIMELYQQTPVERHHEIIISGNRLFFDGEEYIISGIDRELKLIHSHKGLEKEIASIKATLNKIVKR